MRYVVASSLLSLLVAGCGTPTADSPAESPTTSPTTSPTQAPVTTSTPPTTRPTTPRATPSTRPAEKPTRNPRDCFDGRCTLLLSKPVKIRLDKKLFYYPALTVVAVTPTRLDYRVDYPHGGRAEQSLSPGGGGAFGFRSFTQIEVRLISITKGTATLSLTPHPPS